jgi:MFS family permease
MNMLGSSPFLLSLLSTVASLPFFFFTLPAGALADMVSWKKLIRLVNPWLAGAACLLAIHGSLYLLNVVVLLFSVFLLGVGFAFQAPTWSAIVPGIRDLLLFLLIPGRSAFRLRRAGNDAVGAISWMILAGIGYQLACLLGWRL